MILKTLIIVAFLLLVFCTDVIFMLPKLIFFLLIALFLFLFFIKVFRPWFPLQWRRDLYQPRLQPMTEREFERVRQRMRQRGIQINGVRAPELSPGFRKIPANLQPVPIPEQVQPEEEFSNAVNLVMAPHKPAEGVYCQDGNDRVYFITQREVPNNPFFREK